MTIVPDKAPCSIQGGGEVDSAEPPPLISCVAVVLRLDSDHRGW